MIWARNLARKMKHRQAETGRLPYRAAEEIENSLAALWTLKREIDFKGSIIDNAISHLQAARNGRSIRK